MDRPETRYAKSGDYHIAYQVFGDGPVDLVYVPGWISHLVEWAARMILSAASPATNAAFGRMNSLMDARKCFR